MARSYDKIIIANWSALRAKYGTAGERRIRAALADLVVADWSRRLRTKVMALDNATSMRAAGATRVSDVDDWEAAVRAVDLIWDRYQPSYVMLLGSRDVVPQAQVSNPFAVFASDGDPYVPSDLPFACELPTGWKMPAEGRLNPATLLGATRVVGRLPDVVGASDPAFLLRLLTGLTNWKGRPASAFGAFAVSAAAWEGSTRQSLDVLSGPANPLQLSPPARAPWAKTAVAPLIHFVNCHGGDTTPDWFGQAKPVGGRPQPVETVALRPEDVNGKIRRGTIVAAECCYGAMHMDPTDLDGRLPMMWAYLSSGAQACVGASTIAYGPSDGLGQADLLTRFALEAMMGGASSGRALLEARQRFIRQSGTMGPDDLKTLMQFDLLGDPSVVPVKQGGAPKTLTMGGKAAAAAAEGLSTGLIDRRRALRATGAALAESVPRSTHRPLRRAGIGADDLARSAGVAVSRVAGPVQTFGEDASGPRSGMRYHAVPVQSGAQTGFVVSRQRGQELTSTTVWRK